MIVDATGAPAILTHTALAAQTGHKVDGSLTHSFDLTGGICERTPQLRDKLLALVKAKPGNSGIANCSAVMPEVHLPTLTNVLDLRNAGIATLKRGDFANLGGIDRLHLNGNGLTALPAGTFEGLDDTLTSLSLSGNDLQTIAAGVFDPLIGVTSLSLSINDLSSLPPRIFEKLINLTLLDLVNNPGSADFVPIAKAGPEGGIDVVSGGSATLGAAGAENGYDDPWGTNVKRSWTLPAGTTVTYDVGKGADTARPSFTAPATGGTLTFTLTVTGKGATTDGRTNLHRTTSTVDVRVGATAMGPMPVSAVVDGETLTLTYDKDLQQTNSPLGLGSGQGPGLSRRAERARGAAQHRDGGSERGRGDGKAGDIDPQSGGCGGLRGNGDALLLPGQRRGGEQGARPGRHPGRRLHRAAGGQRHARGQYRPELRRHRPREDLQDRRHDRDRRDLRGSGDRDRRAPTLALEIGAARRKAAYVGGSGSAVLTFEYTVVKGEEDTDGIAVEANGLEVPSGSSILNTEDREAAILRHGRYHDPLYKVDGVLPAADAASAAGPTVTVTWSEALDPASLPTGTGGFRVRIGNANGPAVSAVAVSGATTTLSLASAIADGTANVTLEYSPRSGAKIRDAAGNDAAAIPRDDALAVTVTPDTRAPEVSGTPMVDGTTLTVTFDEALDTASVPSGSSVFTVTVTRGGSTVSGYTVSALSLSPNGTVLTLTLSLAVRGGDTVTLAYVQPSSGTKLQDRATTPNEVADFTTGMNSVPAVTNNSTVNAAPTVATVIPDQTATAGTAFSYAFAATTFSDARRRHADLHGDASRRDRVALVAELHRRHADLLGHAAGRGRGDGLGEGDGERRQRLGQRHLRHRGQRGGGQRPDGGSRHTGPDGDGGHGVQLCVSGHHVQRRERRHADLHGDASRRDRVALVAELQRQHADLLGHAPDRGRGDGLGEGDGERRQRLGQRHLRHRGQRGGARRPLRGGGRCAVGGGGPDAGKVAGATQRERDPGLPRAIQNRRHSTRR